MSRGRRTFEITAYVAVASVLAEPADLGEGRDETIIRRAVLGTELSIVDDLVRSAMCSRSGGRLSVGSRPAKGPRLLMSVNCSLSGIRGDGTISKLDSVPLHVDLPKPSKDHWPDS